MTKISAEMRVALIAYINTAEDAICVEFHGATWPRIDDQFCQDGHDSGIALLKQLGGEIAKGNWHQRKLA